jgi:hypothetical protein
MLVSHRPFTLYDPGSSVGEAMTARLWHVCGDRACLSSESLLESFVADIFCAVQEVMHDPFSTHETSEQQQQRRDCISLIFPCERKLYSYSAL